MKKTIAVLLLSALMFSSCSTVQRTWSSVFGHTNPLTGRIWDVRAKRFVTQAALINTLEDVDYVLLGEKHDNPDHHELQAEVIRELAKRGRSIKVGFEQIRRDQTPALKAYMAANPGKVEGLDEALNWKNSGWPPFKIYEPVFRAAIENKFELFALDMGEAERKRVREKGLEGLDDKLFQELNLIKGLPAGVMALLGEEVREAHCYKVPDEVVPRLIEIQRARDAVMASQADSESKRMGAVLILGNGHARNEWGVWVYLQRLNRLTRKASVGFIEVRDEYEKPEVYIEGEAPYDYVWFTPATSREDPCVKHAAELEKIGQESAVSAENIATPKSKGKAKRGKPAAVKKP